MRKMIKRRERNLLLARAKASVTFEYDFGLVINGVPERRSSEIDCGATFFIRDESKGAARMHRIIRDAFEENVKRVAEKEGYKNATWDYGNVDIEVHQAGDVTK